MPITYSPTRKKDWRIDKIDDDTLLGHMEVTPGMKDCMHFSGAAFTLFSFHVEDEHITSISFLFFSSTKDMVHR